MTRITIEVKNETYQKLTATARKTGKKPDDLTRELLEEALEGTIGAQEIKTILKKTGRIRTKNTATQNDIPSLSEVCQALGNAGGPTLESLVDQQRGRKP